MELGRLRLGEKGPKGEPRRRTTWRLTSPSYDLLASAAVLYGGKPEPWDSPSGQQWQLDTSVDTLSILLPPTWDADGQPSVPFSFYFEHWSGGGCLRRCDGETELISGEDCKCDPDKPLCKPTTRVRVMLHELPGFGVWRLESHGWNAAAELPGGLEILRLMADHQRFIEARLRIEQRTIRQPGEPTKQFVVPVLDLATTPAELLSPSSSSVGRVEAPLASPRPALRPAPVRPSPPPPPEATPAEAVERSASAGSERPALPAAPAIPPPAWEDVEIASDSEPGVWRTVRFYADGREPACSCPSYVKGGARPCKHVPKAEAVREARYELAAGVTVEA